jgi:hypothetical protein
VRRAQWLRQAAETGRPYEELLREREMKAKAFWTSYEGNRSIAGVLRYRRAGVQRYAAAQPDPEYLPTMSDNTRLLRMPDLDCAAGTSPSRRYVNLDL